jgi:hypothetical protein
MPELPPSLAAAGRAFDFLVTKVLGPFANFVSRLVITVLYFVLLTLPGVFVRLFQDPLGLRSRSGSNFVQKRDVNPDLAHARRQG